MRSHAIRVAAIRIGLIAVCGNSAACSTEGKLDAGGDGSGVTPGVVTIASAQDTPYAIAVDSTSVYWANSGSFGNSDGSVMKAALDGSSVVTLAPDINAAGGIAVDGASVYVSAAPAGAGALMTVPLNGGEPQVLANGFMNDPFALGPNGVYGTGSDAAGGGGLTIVRVPLTGGATTPVVPSSTLPQTASSYGIATDANSVYWTSFRDPCVVYKAPLAGGTPTTLATVTGPCFGIAVDSTAAYFAASSGVYSVSLNGGTPKRLTSSSAQGIAMDDAFVYFTDFASTVKKVSKSGGAAISLATRQDKPWGIAVDATSVYWVNAGSSGTGSVIKLSPK